MQKSPTGRPGLTLASPARSLAAARGAGSTRNPALVEPLRIVEQHWKGKQNRAARAKRRTAAHGVAAAAETEKVSFLEANTIEAPRLAPGGSRAPLPFVGLMCLVGATLSRRAWKRAVAYLLGFWCYLRPGELLGLKVSQLIAPQQGAMDTWGVRASRTSQFDESVLLDWPEVPALGRALRRLTQNRAEREPPWDFNVAEFNLGWKSDVVRAGLSVLSPHPYTLRHGGASHDLLYKRRDRLEVLARGRWVSESSIRRYGKHSRALKEVSRLEPEVKAYGEMIWENINDFLDSKRACPAPPWSAEQERLQRGLEAVAPTLQRAREGATPTSTRRRRTE